ncbi:hypothetical protein B0H16DRAFT_1688504 [Mycena metata]|uniref:Uncharacterized protein n=1 Tax=Mycena metata TaxID=1033252 RepID=A0AAD7JAT2_9AGAR|nr:hypothetical protein B0H16DRAFT_1688504 [Mycena metata]
MSRKTTPLPRFPPRRIPVPRARFLSSTYAGSNANSTPHPDLWASTDSIALKYSSRAAPRQTAPPGLRASHRIETAPARLVPVFTTTALPGSARCCPQLKRTSRIPRLNSLKQTRTHEHPASGRLELPATTSTSRCAKPLRVHPSTDARPLRIKTEDLLRHHAITRSQARRARTNTEPAHTSPRLSHPKLPSRKPPPCPFASKPKAPHPPLFDTRVAAGLSFASDLHSRDHDTLTIGSLSSPIHPPRACSGQARGTGIPTSRGRVSPAHATAVCSQDGYWVAYPRSEAAAPFVLLH